MTNWTLSTPRAVQDVTGVGKSANERILLLADCSVTLNGVFDDEATTGGSRRVRHHPVHVGSAGSSPSPRPPTTRTSRPTCLLTDYQLTRAATGELTWQVPGSLADGAVPQWKT